ncbi:methionyl-tRNA formyltransferase [Telmatospirillum siberiense]|uniref:Methionyl-tRNA formyltransferase n=2 Tax=Telmatospirillum siberiense TaxID=382514 RepID=A0A2N3Q0U1_9PROT|nr:methionyl-tRNA formyltransferase [Telmatospirillum siberiense]
MGTPDFSVPVLAALIDAGHRVCCVYSQPPRPAGRGQQERPSPVHAFAASRGIPVRVPKTLRDADAQTAFAALEADVGVVAAYGLILPKAVLDAPRFGCLNVHASLLPRWRGAAPIQRAILAGDAQSGVTIMQMDAGLDTGAMLLWDSVPITASTDATALHDALSVMGSHLIVDALDRLEKGGLAATAQPDDGVTYAAKLAKDEGRLDWTRPAVELERAVRAFTPWPGAWFERGGERFKVLAATVADGSGAPGTVLDDVLTVACGSDALRLLKIQRSGRAALDADAFLRGYPLAKGARIFEPCPATN